MSATPRAPTPLERSVHRTLLSGMVVSGLVMGLGLLIALSQDVRDPDGPPPPLRDLFRSALRGDGVALIDLGLLVLIATPALRVVALGVGWLLEGERRFALVAAAVLALLALGMTLGLG